MAYVSTWYLMESNGSTWLEKTIENCTLKWKNLKQRHLNIYKNHTLNINPIFISYIDAYKI
jgi:hypothetical protein